MSGLAIRIPTQPCQWSTDSAARGVVIRYQLTVDRDLGGVIPLPQDIGGCQEPRVGGLIVARMIRGDSAVFCPECDLGPCQRTLPLPATPLRQGQYADSLVWDGTSYSGPSDGNSTIPRRRAPPGVYLFRVATVARRAQSPAQGAVAESDSVISVSATMRLVLTPGR
ncbi:MAG: hypothetical protein FJ206_11815 [Gemmatimonadetes bacterium]|nr:hypothetical protein [Gemmatimonadota bacterium]